MVVGSIAASFLIIMGESALVGRPALRHVANFARQLKVWLGAPVEVVAIDEMEELREERDRSVIIDSGLEREEAMDGANDEERLPGKRSTIMRQKLLFCASLMAMVMLPRLEPHALTAGVLAATEAGVI